MPTDPANPTVHLVGKFSQTLRAEIAQLAGREIRPHQLHRVKLGRVRWQGFDSQPAALPRQEPPGDSAAVGGQTIPQQHHRSADLAVQRAQPAYYPIAIHGARPQREQQSGPLRARRVSNYPDRREPLPIERLSQDRCLPFGGPGAPDAGALGEARFVPEDEHGAAPPRPLFSAGQRSRSHRLMAFSSRSFARFAGFWQLQPSWRKRSQTWL